MDKKKLSPASASPLPIFSLTASFFCSGVLFFIVGLVLALFKLPGLIGESGLHSPVGILMAHLFLLGWATSIAMGASYQLTQVLLHVPVFSRTLGFIHYAFYTGGVAILLLSFPGWHPVGIAIGGILTSVGIVVYIVNLGATFRRADVRNPIVVGSALSLINLAITAALGCVMGIAAASGSAPDRYSLIVGTHIWFGAAGWLSSLILTYSFKLLPMFFISKKKPGWGAWATIVCFQTGIWLTAVGWWSGITLATDAGALLGVAGVAIHQKFAWEVRKLRNAKQAIGPVLVVWWQIPAIFALALIWAGALIGSSNALPSYPIVSTFILLVMGWFAATILGYLSKIVPFLWWAYLFRTKEQKKNAVLLADMVPYRRLTVELVCFVAGIVLVAAANAIGTGGLAATGLAVAIVAAVLYLTELGQVFRY